MSDRMLWNCWYLFLSEALNQEIFGNCWRWMLPGINICLITPDSIGPFIQLLRLTRKALALSIALWTEAGFLLLTSKNLITSCNCFIMAAIFVLTLYTRAFNNIAVLAVTRSIIYPLVALYFTFRYFSCISYWFKFRINWCFSFEHEIRLISTDSFKLESFIVF